MTWRAEHRRQAHRQHFRQPWRQDLFWRAPTPCAHRPVLRPSPGCSVAAPPDRGRTPAPRLVAPPDSLQTQRITPSPCRLASIRTVPASRACAPRRSTAPAPFESSSPDVRPGPIHQWNAPVAAFPRACATVLHQRRPSRVRRWSNRGRGSSWGPVLKVVWLWGATLRVGPNATTANPPCRFKPALVSCALGSQWCAAMGARSEPEELQIHTAG